jgi:hypothetical protein
MVLVLHTSSTSNTRLTSTPQAYHGTSNWSSLGSAAHLIILRTLSTDIPLYTLLQDYLLLHPSEASDLYSLIYTQCHFARETELTTAQLLDHKSSYQANPQHANNQERAWEDIENEYMQTLESVQEEVFTLEQTDIPGVESFVRAMNWDTSLKDCVVDRARAWAERPFTWWDLEWEPCFHDGKQNWGIFPPPGGWPSDNAREGVDQEAKLAAEEALFYKCSERAEWLGNWGGWDMPWLTEQDNCWVIGEDENGEGGVEAKSGGTAAGVGKRQENEVTDDDATIVGDDLQGPDHITAPSPPTAHGEDWEIENFNDDDGRDGDWGPA